MRLEAGFVTQLRDEINTLSIDLQTRLERPGGLGLSGLLSMVSRPEEPSVTHVEDATVDDLIEYNSTHYELGVKAINANQVAFCLLAGGLGTRMRQPKALVRFSSGMSLLGLKLAQACTITPIVMMISPQLKDVISQHVNDLSLSTTVGAFEQFETLRLTPDNRLSIIDDNVELAPSGHGDLPIAMLTSGVLEALFVQGIKYVVISNVDNALSGIDPNILGQHIHHKRPVTLQVVERSPSSDGGVVVFADGKLQAVETFRLPEEYDVKQSRWHNTNTFIVDIEALADAALKTWRWYRVRKTLKTESGTNRLVVQHERLLQQLTEFYETTFVYVPRETHFLPIKTIDDVKLAERMLFTKW